MRTLARALWHVEQYGGYGDDEDDQSSWKKSGWEKWKKDDWKKESWQDWKRKWSEKDSAASSWKT